MKIASIPTRYSGQNFRSRLEARWAAFFDLMRWSWEYEPFDMQGWIPDFVLGGDLEKGLLVEVKPIDWLGRIVGDVGTTRPDFGEFDSEARRAIANAVTHKGILFCGLSPILRYESDYDSYFPSSRYLTWRIGPIWEVELKRFNIAMAKMDKNTGIYDFALTSGPDIYPGAITGMNYNFNQDHIDAFCGSDDASEKWREAGNIVQWRAR